MMRQITADRYYHDTIRNADTETRHNEVNNLYKIWKRKDTDLNVAKQINSVGRKKAPNCKPRIRGLFAF